MSRRERFERLEKEKAPAPAPAALLGAPARFGAPPPPEERPLHVLEHEGMPFVRCCVCRSDNHLTATRCQNCGDDLESPVQRAFNQALSRQHVEESAREREEADRVRAARRQADAEAREAQRRAFDHLMDMDALRAGVPRSRGDEVSWGLALARRIRDPRLRLAALVAAAVVPVLLMVAFPGGSSWFRVGLLLAIVVAIAFLPPRYRRGLMERRY
jgi:hypothetical protein